MKKLLPIILALIGTGAGVGAGIMFAPADEPETAELHCPEPEEMVEPKVMAEEEAAPETREYVKLSNQFIVPVVGANRIESLVVAALSVEVETGNTEAVYAREPKLRDAFLQVMFDHANIGGFDGAFTTGERMKTLRRSLLSAATPILGDSVSDVLITEISRQDS